MATLRELIDQGRIFCRRRDWRPDEFVHVLWSQEGSDGPEAEVCLCQAPTFPDALLNDDQWEPGGTPALEASMETTELVVYDRREVSPWQVGGMMEA